MCRPSGLDHRICYKNNIVYRVCCVRVCGRLYYKNNIVYRVCCVRVCGRIYYKNNIVYRVCCVYARGALFAEKTKKKTNDILVISFVSAQSAWRRAFVHRWRALSHRLSSRAYESRAARLRVSYQTPLRAMAPIRSTLARTTCCVCLCSKPANATLRCTTCECISCIKCFKTYFAEAEDDTCVSCSYVYTVLQIRDVLGREDFARQYLDKRGRVLLRGKRNDIRALATKARTPDQLFPCMVRGCSGFVVKAPTFDTHDDGIVLTDTAYRCDTCLLPACVTCRQQIATTTNNEHVCRREDVATVEALAAMRTKPCPGCGMPAEKQANTCDQMYCVLCKTTFRWSTLAVSATGVHIHNPEYHDRLRALGLLTRATSDVSDRIINLDLVPMPILSDSVLALHYLMVDICAEYLPRYENADDYGNDRDLHELISNSGTAEQEHAVGMMLARRELDARVRKGLHDALSDVVHGIGTQLTELCSSVTTTMDPDANVDLAPVQFISMGTLSLHIATAIYLRVKDCRVACDQLIASANEILDAYRTRLGRRSTPHIYYDGHARVHIRKYDVAPESKPAMVRHITRMCHKANVERTMAFEALEPALRERALRRQAMNAPPVARPHAYPYLTTLANLRAFLHLERLAINEEVMRQRDLLRLHQLQRVADALQRLLERVQLAYAELTAFDESEERLSPLVAYTRLSQLQVYVSESLRMIPARHALVRELPTINAFYDRFEERLTLEADVMETELIIAHSLNERPIVVD
jgi:hypothetical protein